MQVFFDPDRVGRVKAGLLNCVIGSAAFQITGTVRARDENISRMATGENRSAGVLADYHQPREMFCRLTLSTRLPKKRVLKYRYLRRTSPGNGSAPENPRF